MQLATKIVLGLSLCLLFCAETAVSRSSFLRRSFKSRNVEDKGLFLSPLIEKNAIKEARQASLVKILKTRVNATGYSGFITVNKEHQANLFFVYMEALINPEQAPILIYLQGGPGKSSTFGQFLEVGPLGINSQGVLYRRVHTVQRMFNVLFLDQPAGAGFSFTKSSMGYARSSEECGIAIREFLRQFLIMFPEIKGRDLYTAGESYGSRAAVTLAHSLLTKQDPSVPLKVSGVIVAAPAVGNVLDLMDSSDTLFHYGMLDHNGHAIFNQAMQRVRGLWSINRTLALHLLSHTIFRLHPTPSLFSKLTGYNDHASLLSDQRPPEFVHYYRYMQRPLLKKSLHLSPQAVVDSNRLHVMLYLAGDYLIDLRDKMEYLLDATKVLAFWGTVDTVLPAVKLEKYILSLNWTGTAALRKAARRPWYESGEGSKLVGYVKTTKGLTCVALSRAGHHTTFDASPAVFKMIELFVSGVDIVSSRRNVVGVN
ncbi:venom serine carboxypeptidase-like [Amblyomma americanum]